MGPEDLATLKRIEKLLEELLCFQGSHRWREDPNDPAYRACERCPMRERTERS